MEIKHLLSVNLTEKKDNSVLDDTPFTTVRLSPETRARKESATQDAVEVLVKRTRSPLMLVARVLMLIGLVCLGGFIKAMAKIGLSTALQNGKWILLIGIVLMAAGGIPLVRSKKKSADESDEESPEETAANRSLDTMQQLVEMELGIPSEDQVTEVDMLPFTYKITADGAIKEQLLHGCLSNVCGFVWREEETLCLTDYDCVIKIPLSAAEGYYTVHGKYKIDVWYKDKECSEEPYAAFQIREDSDFNYRLPTYYRVIFRDGEDRFEMRIPNYDFAPFCELIPLTCLDADGGEQAPV
jgi:hypothetical protein